MEILANGLGAGPARWRLLVPLLLLVVLLDGGGIAERGLGTDQAGEGDEEEEETPPCGCC